MLIGFLIGYGNAVGRGPHILRGDAEHGPNEYACVVGETGTGAKDTAWAAVSRVIRAADPSVPIAGGLVSGEGLVHHVRDPRVERRPKKRGDPPGTVDADGYVTETVDVGADDKRILVIESEFARVLAATSRPDNTLSAVLRLFWDHGSAQTLAKNSRDKASRAHVSVIALITPTELQDRIGLTDMSNGFVNRFVFVCSRRSKLLPDGGSVPKETIMGLAARIAGTFKTARVTLETDMTADAQALWREHYARLRTPPEGVAGAALARAAVHVLRFALIYMLLDERPRIHREHLEAALEIWRFCEASALYLFGGATGNELADRILRMLQLAPAGLTRSDINAQLDHHQPSSRIEDALGALLVRGLVRFEWEETGGRPAQRWHAGGGPTTT